MDLSRRIRLARILGIAFAAAGFVAMGLGWNGAAGKDCVDCQIPYLISGGAVGLGLVALGVGMLLLAQIYDFALRMEGRIRHLEATGPASAGAVVTGGEVLVGGTTFHLADCRLVKDREGLPGLSYEAALGQGLTPCRVCHPERRFEQVGVRN